MTKYVYVVMCEHFSKDGDTLGMSPIKAFYSESAAETFADTMTLKLTSVQHKEYYIEDVELDSESNNV